MMRIKQYTICIILVCFSALTVLAQPASSNLNVLENSLSAVVTVAVYENDFAKKSMGFRGDPAEMAYAKMLDLSGAQGSGSGFLVKHNNQFLIITNAHVVEQASEKDGSIYVYTINRSKYKARVVGGDSFYDIAVLEFTDQPGKEVSSLELRALPARIGERVYAIGNPLGEYPYSVSDGIISAKNRVRGGLTGKFGFLQTTATVIWGNSGGPLIDADGQVLGINSQIAFANQGNTSIWQPQINFALEAPLAQRLISDIVNNGIVSRSFLGVSFAQKKLLYSPDTKEYAYYSRQYEQDQRPVISSVLEHSPAESLRSYVGYQIIAIDNETVRNLEEVLGALEESKPGQKLVFTLQKGGQQQKVTVTTGALNRETAAIIGAAFLKQADAGYTISSNAVSLTFKRAGEKGSAIDFAAAKSESGNQGDAPLTGEWQVLGIGLFSRDQESMWRVSDLADVGTAARLTGLAGVIDIALFRKGGNPDVTDNYKMKHVTLSNNTHLLQHTLWY